MNLRSLLGQAAGSALLVLLAACGGGGGEIAPASTYTVGGTVAGLATGAQVVVNNGGTDPLTISANGAYTFANQVVSNGTYAVTVTTQPTGQTCSVANGSGAGVTANVSNADITCSDISYAVGGTVSGLGSGQQVTLSNNGVVANVTADGSFTIPASAPFNGTYAVSVTTQPTGQTCTVSNGIGAGVTADVTNVAVACAVDTFTVSGTLSGLASGQQVTLTNNGGDAVTVSADGSFTFPQSVAFNGGYAVVVGTQPTGQTCTVSSGVGAGVTSNISDVTVACSTNTFTIGGAVTGLASGQQVTLVNAGGMADQQTVTADGSFTFGTSVAFNGSYAVTVATQPTGQTCTVSNGSGAGVTANIANVTVNCSTNTYTVSGTVAGLAGGRQVTLRNNGANPTTVNANGAFSFSTQVAYNGAYAVTVGTQPTGQTCTVSNGSGTVTGAVTNVSVTCSTNTYTVSGTVNGLTTGQQVTLNNAGANATTVSFGGSQNFSFTVNYGGNYTIQVGTYPTAQYCTVASGTGTNVTANVTGVSVSCRALVAYVINKNDATVQWLNVASDGSLSVGGGLATGTAGAVPQGIAVDPARKFLYVANSGDANVALFTINADGSLTAGATTASPALTSPWGVTVDPTGSYLYVVDRDNGAGSSVVSQYAINSTTGALTPLGTPTVTVPNRPHYVTINAAGTFAYVAEWDNAQVSVYSISGGSLSASPVSTAPAGNSPLSVTLDASGTHAYVANYGDGTVSQYTVAGNGALTPMSTATVAAGTSTWPVTIDPSGRYAYVANAGSDNVTQYSIDASTGALTNLGNVAADFGPQGIAIDPRGTNVYVVNGNHDSVWRYTIGGGGTLTHPGGASTTTDAFPFSIILTTVR